ncbi:MAG: TrkA family potassium uptake protein [Actinomycetota bacterium]
MHVVILGCGRVGSALSIQLTKRGHSVAVIDKRPEAFDRLPPGFEAQTVVGIGFDRDVLVEAGIKLAAEDGAFVAVSNGDNSNIVSARIAREHYHVKKVIARIYDPRRAEIYERLNIPTVASARWAAQQIEFLLFHGKEELKESFAGGTLLHLQKGVPDHLVGAPISSVEAPGAIQVAGVDRGGTGFIPVDNSTFQQDDIAHFVVTQDAVDQLDTLLQPLAE